MIETESLSKHFGATVAVSGLNLRVEGGEVMGFLGPNGSGKTTTIRLLMGLLRPTAGRAAILGRDCHTDAVALKRDVGYLPDEPFLYPYLSGTETLELVAGLHGFALSNYFATLQEPELRIDIVRPVWLEQMADTERLLTALEAAPMARIEPISAGIAK